MMKKHKGKLLFGCIVVLLLVASFFAGEPMDKTKSSVQTAPQEIVLEERSSAISKESGEEKEKTERKTEKTKTVEETVKEEVKNEPEVERDALSEPPKEIEPTQEKVPPTCTLVVRCDSVFDHLDDLREGKEEILPENGIILRAENVSFSEGESVFDVLKRELRARGIHFEFVETPMCDSVYIEGIANLYEFDCGELSGWMYRVNGVRPTYGCSQYILKNKDSIEFYYSPNWLE